MFGAAKSASIQATWSGSGTYTLTNAYVASAEIVVDFPKRITIYPYYSAGAAETSNTLDIVVESNPLDSTEDSAGTYWAQEGNYINTAGTWQEQNSKYLVTQGTPGTYEPGVPIYFTCLNAKRIRIKVKENGVAANYGTIRMWVVKADIS